MGLAPTAHLMVYRLALHKFALAFCNKVEAQPTTCLPCLPNNLPPLRFPTQMLHQALAQSSRRAQSLIMRYFQDCCLNAPKTLLSFLGELMRKLPKHHRASMSNTRRSLPHTTLIKETIDTKLHHKITRIGNYMSCTRHTAKFRWHLQLHIKEKTLRAYVEGNLAD